MGNAIDVRLSLNPKIAIIHALMVLHMFAPIIVPIALSKLNIFAPTNPRISIVMIELLCSIAVVAVPDRIPLRGVAVRFSNIFLRNFPPTFFILI